MFFVIVIQCRCQPARHPGHLPRRICRQQCRVFYHCGGYWRRRIDYQQRRICRFVCRLFGVCGSLFLRLQRLVCCVVCGVFGVFCRML